MHGESKWNNSQQQKWVFYCLSDPEIPQVIWSQVVFEVIQHVRTGPFIHTFTKGLEGFLTWVHGDR